MRGDLAVLKLSHSRSPLSRFLVMTDHPIRRHERHKRRHRNCVQALLRISRKRRSGSLLRNACLGRSDPTRSLVVG